MPRGVGYLSHDAVGGDVDEDAALGLNRVASHIRQYAPRIGWDKKHSVDTYVRVRRVTQGGLSYDMGNAWDGSSYDMDNTRTP